MKIAITGASGFIGQNLLKALRDGGAVPLASDLCGSFGVTALDLRDSGSVRNWLVSGEPEVVVHLAARTDLLGRSIGDYEVNIAGVSNLIAAARAASSVKRVIFASSRMVCRIDDIPDSYDHYSPPNPYGASKVEGERLVKGAGLPFEWTIVRPTSIWGPGFGIPYRNFFDQVSRRRYFHQRGHNPLKSFGYVGNTVYQLIKLIEAPKAAVDRRTFYLGDYEPVAIRDWANYIHESFGLARKIPDVPMPMLRCVAKVGDCLNAISGKDHAPLTTFRLNNLITHMVYPQLEELRLITGPLPFDWREGTRRTVQWLRTGQA